MVRSLSRRIIPRSSDRGMERHSSNKVRQRYNPDRQVVGNIYWLLIKLSRSSKVGRWLIDNLGLNYYRLFRKQKEFIFQGREYPYFYHPYNRTIASERIIEISIAKGLLDQYQGKKVLEVGNVMSHYFPANHDILDKYESGKGVINADVAEYSFKKKYDLIISISTMEHVGFNYPEEDNPGKFIKALNNLKNALAPEGQLFVTFPVSFNPNLKKLILTGKIPFSGQYVMERFSYLNEWREVSVYRINPETGYDRSFANADYIFLGTYFKDKRRPGKPMGIR